MSEEYIALTSCRNEERLIGRTIKSVLRQDPPHAAYVVVDDGSTDNTVSIVSSFSGVELLRLMNARNPVRGVNLSWALNAGVRRATELVPGWRFLLKVDADSLIPRDYLRSLLSRFKRDPSLGIASGMPFDEEVWRGRAADGAKIYRRECLNDIGPFYPCNAFDTMSLLKAKYYGWKVESFHDIRYTQLRTWRRRRFSRWILSGRSRYYLGFPWWHTFLVSIVYATHRPPVFGSLSMFLSHMFSRIGSAKRPLPQEFYTFTRRYALQEFLERIKEKRLKRLKSESG